MKRNQYFERMADKEFAKYEICLEMAKEYFEKNDYHNMGHWLNKAKEHLRISADIRDGLVIPEGE